MWLRRTNQLLQRSIHPTLWQQAVARLDPCQILPVDSGGRAENKNAAWYGDKLLGYHVAKCTVELFGTSLDRDVASKIAAVALSNRHMYKNVSIILPGYEASWTAPTAGTSVEAAVALVRAEENEDLAQWLVKTAINAKIKGAR